MIATLPRELAVVSLTAGPDTVGRYAELTTDFNPIHLDPEFAAGTMFGQPIIHGTLGLNLVMEAIERTFGAFPTDAEIDARFVRPIPVGCVTFHLIPGTAVQHFQHVTRARNLIIGI
ncbi:hypothetical protein CHELA1G11_40020 [Hyphomicrobiales bacterium]|nr:hypothetical protein CHELA1G11_40020 [Hyphomicrobiales bacterium]CAH1696546.1 hypothetical protein CHELA1G2_40120 [Hyphomicrobiales bacterium]